MNDKELQQLIDDIAARFGVAGAQLAIYDGSQHREFATGHRNREIGLLVTTDTLFQIGSTSKLFNAALILSLVDAGKLSLDEPVCNQLRDLRLADEHAQQSITLRQLLSMSAGLDNGTYYDYGRGNDAVGRYVEGLAGVPHIFPPGTAFGYSNASSIVAGHTAARATGQTWEDLITQQIFAPLGLKRYALLPEDALSHPVALGYERLLPGAAAVRAPIGLKRSMGPSGAMTYCSAGDLLRLAHLFLDGGKSSEGAQVLSAAAVELMQQPHASLATRFFADEWCVGPYRKVWGGHALHGHSGTTRSGSSTLLWSRAKNIAAAVTVNVADQGYPFADAVFDVVFPALFNIAKPKAPTPEGIATVAADLAPYIGRFAAFGMTLDVTARDGRLLLSGVTGIGASAADCELIALGNNRFMPRNAGISGNRNWDLAFWGSDSHGRATHLLQGVFPMRRTG